MVFGKLKTIGVDQKLHEHLKQEAARTSEASGRHVSVREWLAYALLERINLADENEQLRQQLENVDLNAEYKKKLNEEVAAIENRALAGTQKIVAYTAEIVELAEETAKEMDALARDNEDAQKSVDAQNLVIALRNNIFTRRVKMNEDADKMQDQFKGGLKA